ncbi:uncharacterized protein CANTADRAFT_127621 [Suhomyces tanzawaensis NRRL Y-17324]|uniref:Uncharacterized protein n=1 Tax=Suhomyces tanzawaensis NRRL Y-17324 TaxID=984487 RepID=A0A1E4SQT4_9ASCO|nr:uncharacterized protein CANTADRAFT_127621 [Suhomyces tanzawaensis NRRL Y-17324]ODV81873.1 hypothetical protein CANTADRAFT_127621 [Suhomyces tanzawaensis NRRL Y-17324]
MPSAIPTNNLQEKIYQDLEKSNPLHPVDSASSVLHYNPATSGIKRKLLLLLLVETVISLVVYYNYEHIGSLYTLLAPTLLGASTAALAQTLNQYQKKKLSINRILKFIVWGSINGYFTVLWIDMLIFQFDNLFYRIAVDQLVGAPTFQLFFTILNSLWDHGELTKKTRIAYMISLRYSYCFWPFFSVASFMLIPQSMMFPCNCLANLIWNIILSRLA